MDPRTHIDRLLRAFPTARNVSSNPNEYVGIFEIPLTVNNNLLIQRIYLRYNFPSSPPKIQIVGHLIHPWLDCYGRVVNCPSLNGWDSITSLLDDVVQDVLLGLQVGLSNQPPNMIDKSASLSHATNTISSSSSVQAVGVSYHESRLASPPSYEEVMEESASTAHAEVLPLSPKPLKPPLKPISKPLLKSDSRPASMSFEGPFNIPVPAIPNSFPELQNLSEVQLQRLLNDDVALEAHVERFFSKEKVMKQYHRELRKLNKSQCEANIAQKDALLALRNEVGASQLALKERVKEFQTHSSSQTSKHLIPTESILFQLNTRLHDMDREADELAERFIAGSLDLESFLKDFTKTKASYYELSLKIPSVTASSVGEK